VTETLLLLVGAVSTFANRVSEAVKAWLKAKRPGTPPETVSLIALLVSLAAGIVGALVLNVNLLTLLPASPYTAHIPPWVGVLLTGCIASLGSETMHGLLDLLQARRDEMATPMATAKVETTSPVASARASAAVSSTPTVPPPDAHG
jgi:hypothetical protein